MFIQQVPELFDFLHALKMYQKLRQKTPCYQGAQRLVNKVAIVDSAVCQPWNVNKPDHTEEETSHLTTFDVLINMISEISEFLSNTQGDQKC